MYAMVRATHASTVMLCSLQDSSEYVGSDDSWRYVAKGVVTSYRDLAFL